MNFLQAKQMRNWVLSLSLLFSMPLSALEVKGLFEIEVVANSQSAEARVIAIKQALYAVLDRILVSEDISKISVAQQMLSAAEHYVKQSQFSLLPADEYAATDARLLRVQFDEDQILEALRKSQVGVWSEIRPETLLWLIVDENGARQFYNADAMPEIDGALTFLAKLKGLPLIFPLLDIEEQQKISVTDVLGADSGNLLAASARYDAPAIMVGHLIKKGGCWQADWAFHFDGKIKQWNSTCEPLKATISVGVKGAYNVLSAYYGVKPELGNTSGVSQ
jgi:uncharacterized protein